MTTIRKTLTRKSTKTFYRDGKKVTQRKTYRKVTRTPKVVEALAVSNAAQAASAAPAPTPASAAPAERVLLRKEFVRSYRRADGVKMNVYKNVYRKAAPAPVETVRVLVRSYVKRTYRRADGKRMRVLGKVYRTVPKTATRKVLVKRELVRRYRRADGKMMKVFKNTFRRELAA